MAKQIIITEVANLVVVEGKSRTEVGKIYGLNARQLKMLFTHPELKDLYPAPGLVIIDDTKEEIEEIAYSHKGQEVSRKKYSKKMVEVVPEPEVEVSTEKAVETVKEDVVEATVVEAENADEAPQDSQEDSDGWFED